MEFQRCTWGAFRRGCTCPECSEVRRARPPSPARARRLVGLDVLCWCERAVVGASPDDIRKGLTGSCGRADCHPPALTGAYPGG